MNLYLFLSNIIIIIIYALDMRGPLLLFWREIAFRQIKIGIDDGDDDITQSQISSFCVLARVLYSASRFADCDNIVPHSKSNSN